MYQEQYGEYESYQGCKRVKKEEEEEEEEEGFLFIFSCLSIYLVSVCCYVSLFSCASILF